MATDEGQATSTKRCPRCETTKHRSEFTTMGYCRPCSRDYDRARNARRNEEAGRPAPKPRKPATIQDVVRNVEARKANGETKPALPETIPARPETISPSAETIPAPRETLTGAPPPIDRLEPSGLSGEMISDSSRHRSITRAIAESLLAALEDGETLSVTATRFGRCIVIDDIDDIGVSREYT
jgi:hypothetical protein